MRISTESMRALKRAKYTALKAALQERAALKAAANPPEIYQIMAQAVCGACGEPNPARCRRQHRIEFAIWRTQTVGYHSLTDEERDLLPSGVAIEARYAPLPQN